MTSPDNLQPALLAEGDRLARRLAQTLGGLQDQQRLVFVGRTLAFNLLQAFTPTIEQISRHAGRPLPAQIVTDERRRAVVEVMTADGELLTRLPAEDLIESFLFRGGHLHPVVRAHLERALGVSEHQATRALVDTLRSAPVMHAMQRQLSDLLARHPGTP